MRVVTSPRVVRGLVRNARRVGETVGLVPTMGALHAGHRALLRSARRENDRLVVSIFVNPLQFGPREDYRRYPRHAAKDAQICRAEGADCLFSPRVSTVYPSGFSTRVVPGPIGSRWEGAARPGHFTGVLTIVLKLLAMVEPDRVYLGQKDAQQAVLLTRMVRDLNLPVRVLVRRTVRDRDGLALSSRNDYLSREERVRAAGLPRALFAARDAARGGRRDPKAVLAVARRTLVRDAKPDRIDYLALVDGATFEPVRRLDGRALLIAAVRIGATRLIDNVRLAGRGSRR